MQRHGRALALHSLGPRFKLKHCKEKSDYMFQKAKRMCLLPLYGQSLPSFDLIQQKIFTFLSNGSLFRVLRINFIGIICLSDSSSPYKK